MNSVYRHWKMCIVFCRSLVIVSCIKRTCVTTYYRYSTLQNFETVMFHIK